MMLAVAFSRCSPRSFARFAYTFLSKPKALSCRVQVSSGRLKRSQAALMSASWIAAKFFKRLSGVGWDDYGTWTVT